jgi:hypothetical protein
MTATDTEQRSHRPKQDTADDLRFDIAWALSWSGADLDYADEVIGIVESAVRWHFKLTATEFDLAFTDTKREIEQVLDRAIDRDLAVDAITHELSKDEDSE